MVLDAAPLGDCLLLGIGVHEALHGVRCALALDNLQHTNMWALVNNT
jgi:hypothetical protein